MRRREFLGLVGGAAAWPLAARAQQVERVRRVGVLVETGGALPQERLEAFHREMRNLGWTNGTNVEFDIRSGDNTPAKFPTLALPLIAQ